MKDVRIDEVDRTPAENLAYQVRRTILTLKWESDELRGLEVKTPIETFKWNQLGELYQYFTDTYVSLTIKELTARLSDNVYAICNMIDSMGEEVLFKPHMCKWADRVTKNAV